MAQLVDFLVRYACPLLGSKSPSELRLTTSEFERIRDVREPIMPSSAVISVQSRLAIRISVHQRNEIKVRISTISGCIVSAMTTKIENASDIGPRARQAQRDKQ